MRFHRNYRYGVGCVKTDEPQSRVVDLVLSDANAVGAYRLPAVDGDDHLAATDGDRFVGG